MENTVPEAAGNDAPVVVRDGHLARSKRFLRRHETMLAIAGSIIALVSFAVREELQNTYRERLSTLRQAAAENRHRLDAHKTESMLLDTMGSVAHLNPGMPRLSSDERSDSLKQLMNDLNAVRDYQALLVDSDLNHGVIKTKTDQLLASISNTMNGKASPADDAIFADQADVVSGKVRNLDGDIQSAFTRESEITKNQLRVTSRVGIAVFALGWLLSFVSKLLGKEEEPEE